MRPRILAILFLFIPFCLQAESIFEEELEEMLDCQRGKSCFTSAEENGDPSFFAFVSFSMPENVWIEMSKGLERNGGVFILRGFPEQSIHLFIQKVMELRKKGVYAPITVDPDSFDHYGIEAVPTFVLESEQGYRKVVGNVTVDYALENLRREKFN